MAKSEKELNELKKQYEELSEKFRELTEEELAKVIGGEAGVQIGLWGQTVGPQGFFWGGDWCTSQSNKQQ